MKKVLTLSILPLIFGWTSIPKFKPGLYFSNHTSVSYTYKIIFNKNGSFASHISTCTSRPDSIGGKWIIQKDTLILTSLLDKQKETVVKCLIKKDTVIMFGKLNSDKFDAVDTLVRRNKNYSAFNN